VGLVNVDPADNMDHVNISNV